MSGSHRGGPEAAGWNVIVTLAEPTARAARKMFARWGRLRATHFYNVHVLEVESPERFLAEFAASAEREPGLLNAVSHVVPLQHLFDFVSPEEFEAKASEAVLRLAPHLGGKSFHVRLHRRGFKGVLSTPKEERFLDEVLLNALAQHGMPGRIAFDDPDAIIQVESVDGRAGLSLWNRDELRRLSFLAVD
jgi:tRNA(Ser,Leu) C12 N-acetylase TAN1